MEISSSQMLLDDVRNDQQTVKCVVVGDTGVGKTRLICSRACATRYSVTQLVQTHIPTVWAIDQYRKNPQVLTRSWCNVDGVPVSLRLWDTFGDHDKDRRFAYDRADVVLVCFAVTQPRSLRNVKMHWFPEITRFCPGIPIILCGCQVDLRYLYKDPKFVSIEKGPFFREINEADILLPDTGRAIAKQLGAHYYESSVLEQFGIDTVFVNAARAALSSKRERHFWQAFGVLKRISRPLAQEPHLSPRPLPPTECPVGEPALLDYTSLLEGGLLDELADVVFVIQGIEYVTHRVCLSVAATSFEVLFRGEFSPDWNSRSESRLDDNSITAETITQERVQISNTVTSYHNDSLEIESIANSLSNTDDSDFSLDDIASPVKRAPVWTSVETRAVEDDRGVSRTRTFVTVANWVSMPAWLALMQYCMSGRCPQGLVESTAEETRRLAEALDMSDLSASIANVRNGEDFLNVGYEKRFQAERLMKIENVILNESLFSDVTFKLDDGFVNAHRLLLAKQCDVMSSMFLGNFTERSSKMISFPGATRDVFIAMLEYLYLGRCRNLPKISSLELIELANRLCQPQFIELVERAMLKDFMEADQRHDNITTDVLALLETAQLHNANQLAAWCLWYLSVNYSAVYKTHSKLLHRLRPENQIYLSSHRWPSVWYIKELDLYERSSLELQREKTLRSYLRKGSGAQGTSAQGCFCFSARRNQERKLKDAMAGSNPAVRSMA